MIYNSLITFISILSFYLISPKIYNYDTLTLTNFNFNSSISINEWIKVTTGYNADFKPNEISFTTVNYKNALNKWNKIRFEMTDCYGNNLAKSNPKITISPDMIMLEFEGCDNIKIIASAYFYIYSIHHGSSGECKIVNLTSGNIQLKEFEVLSLKGSDAYIYQSWHDSHGTYRSGEGIYNLKSNRMIKFIKH